jgi:hypothetical protein
LKSHLVVIAGHGAADPGTARGELVERELTIQTVLGMNDYIGRTWKAPPPTLIISPKADAPGGEELLRQRIERVNRDYGDDALICDVHFNAEAEGSGCQVWYSQNAATTAGDETNAIAPLLVDELGKVVHEVVPLIRSDRSRFGGLGILDNTQGTAVLCEMREVASDVLPEITPAIVYAGGAALARAFARYYAWPPLPAPSPTPPPAPAATDAAAIAAELEQLAARVRTLAGGR